MALKTTLKTDVNSFLDGAPLQEHKPLQKEKKNKIISITLRQSDLQSMDDFCNETGMSRSNLVRLAVQKYIEKYNKK